MLMNIVLGSSWKTTLLGYLVAIADVILPLLQDGNVTWERIVRAVLITLFARFVADAKKLAKEDTSSEVKRTDIPN